MVISEESGVRKLPLTEGGEEEFEGLDVTGRVIVTSGDKNTVNQFNEFVHIY